MRLKVNELEYCIQGIQILDGVSLQVEEGEFVGLIGPNGCGKSTLLKNIYRTYKPGRNAVFIGGEDVMAFRAKELAREVSVVAQENSVEFDMEVLDMVMYGRYSHKKMFQGERKEDLEICKRYIREVGLQGYEHRSYLSLSGGEKQRILLARALVQESKLIVLDEPTNHLDIRFQYLIMQTLKRQNITVFSALHDLNIAAMYCDKIVLMDHGRIVEIGTPKEVITEENIKKIFGVSSQVTENESTGKIQVYYLPEGCILEEGSVKSDAKV
ncbi:MAG: ABC transporter ATP-binding protein [Hespellia sp.]|jgi:iron complex transport system ATP-binding protein|nr:ABC transporter ATP-binding protein [Hespellia sp.]